MKLSEMLLQQMGHRTVRAIRRHEEDDLQMNCIRWFDAQFPQLALQLHHSPNEGRLVGGVREGTRRKRRGVRAGFPDLIFLLPNRTHHGLAIELKTEDGRLSKAQRQFQSILSECGYRFEVVRSLKQFQQLMHNYIFQPNT